MTSGKNTSGASHRSSGSRSGATIIFGLIAVALGLVIGGLVLPQYRAGTVLAATGYATTATIQDVESWHRPKKPDRYYFWAEARDEAGQALRVRSASKRSRGAFEMGEQVDVLIDRTDPSKSRFAADNRPVSQGLGLAAVGLAFFGVGMLLLRSPPSSKA